MPLKLVTGPANAAKAGVVLGDYRARLGESPVLVVPAFRDVEHSQRELAERGAVFGTEVMRFSRLFRRVADRCGLPGTRVASRVQRELVMERAVRSLSLRELGASAGRPGFTRAAVRFVADLERSAIEPDRFEDALARWAGRGPRRRYAQEVASVYSAYREALDAAGLLDEDLFAWRAVEALREDASLWGATPVFFYGFDSFTPLELDAIEALATGPEATVAVSLPYERGRAAFRAVVPVFERLSGIASEHVELDATDEHYAPGSRAALHHLERRLYEDPGESPHPGDAVRLNAAGGERAEVELVGAEVLKLLRAGTDPGQVAVVFREPGRYASVVEQVFDAYGIPFSIDTRVPLGHTALGRGLLALLRCAGDGSADDLLAYLRTPGRLDRPGIADALEADVRRNGAQTAKAARRLWEARGGWRLHEIDELRDAAGDPALLVERLDVQLEQLFSAPYVRRASLFGPGERDDPRVFAASRRALGDLHALAADSAFALDRRGIEATLESLDVPLGEAARPDRVQVASPNEIRARRFEAVFVCGLQEGEFPRPQGAEPFLSEDDRRAIAAASGVELAAREDQIERERYLFYVCTSRAERVLVLSSRFADEEGNPRVGSFFVEDVRDLFSAIPELRRSLSDVTWPPAEAPTAAEWDRAAALAGPVGDADVPDGLHEPAVLADLEARTCLSAGALESYADCPVKWLVEKLIDPQQLEPDPEPMVRGRYAHDVLQATYARLGSRVTEDNVEEAERILLEEMRARQGDFQISPNETRVRTAVRRLEFDLLRLLRHEAERGSRFRPQWMELAFGLPEEDGSRPALELEDEGISIRGRIDRVDTLDGHALVRDYKSGKSAYPVAKWGEENRLQVALYMLAVRELLDLEPVGGVYVPLADPKGRPRGLLLKEAADELGGGFVGNDLKEREEFEEELAAARRRVGELAARMRSGEVRPCPESCAWNGGCSYPSICREEG